MSGSPTMARALQWGVVVVTSASHAEEAPTALADTLFADGRKLMKAGDHEGAIPKLLESHRLLPRGGTVLNLAICYHRVGKTASAHVRYREALAYAVKDKNDERRVMAEDAIAEIEPTLSRLTVTVTTEVPGLEVRLDDQRIPRTAWGTAFPVDPGPRRLRAEAPGKVAWERALSIGAVADAQTVTVPTLVDAPKPVVPLAPVVPVDRPSDGRRTAAWIVGGTGLLVLGVGGYFGFSALAKKKQSDDHCPFGRCDAEGSTLSTDAVRAANWSTLFVASGSVLLGVGGVLLLTAPSGGSARATLSIGVGTISLHGAF